jgi:hypothetical protein
MDRSRRVLAACTLFALACAGGSRPAAPTAPETTLPVIVSSMPSSYGIQLRLRGSAVVRDGWVYVAVPTGAVRTYQGTAPAWDLMLRAGLASCTVPRGWKVVSESQAVRLAPAVGFTRDSSLLDTTPHELRDTLHFAVGLPPGTDPARTWLTFELAWPIENVLASYTLASGTVLAPASGWDGRREGDAVCRR